MCGEPGHPAPLSGCLGRSWPVVPAGPVDGIDGGVPGEDGHAGDDGARAPDAAVARHLDALPGPGQRVGATDRGGGRMVVTRSAEIRPVDPDRAPVRLPAGSTVAPEASAGSARRWMPEVEAEVRQRPGREALATTTPADHRPVGQHDRAVKQMGHRIRHKSECHSTTDLGGPMTRWRSRRSSRVRPEAFQERVTLIDNVTRVPRETAGQLHGDEGNRTLTPALQKC